LVQLAFCTHVPGTEQQVPGTFSRCGPFAPALALLRAWCVDLTSLIHAHYLLADASGYG
jgi:hypothetical protein